MLALQIAAAFSFLTVMGGKLRYQSSTIYGGLIGGIIVTLLLLLINFGLVTEFNQIKEAALPSLLLAADFSIHWYIMSVIMVLVIYNTVGLMYAFASRFSRPFTKRYYILYSCDAIITFACTFVGFISLIGKCSSLWDFWFYLIDSRDIQRNFTKIIILA